MTDRTSPNLSDAFGGSAKAGDGDDPFAFFGTDGPFVPGPSPIPETEPPETQAAGSAREEPPAASTPPPPEPPPEPVAKAASPATERQEPEEGAESATSQVQIYLKSWAKKTATRLAKAEGLSNAQIAYDAIDEAQRAGTLRRLITGRQIDPRAADSLFPSHSKRRRSRHWTDEGGARTLWSIQATPEEREILERLAIEHDAESVSQFVSAAVEAYLEDHPLRGSDVELRPARRPS